MYRIFIILTVIGSVWGTNIIVNPSFEIWLDTLGVNLPFGWLSSELLYPGSATKDTNCNSGYYCVHLTGGDTMAFVSTVTVVRPGFSYEFAGYAFVPSAVGGSFVIQFLTMLGNPLGSPVLIPLYYSSGYRRYSRWVTAPDSAMFVSVSCVSLPGVSIYVDDVTLEDTAIVSVNEEEKTIFYPSINRKVVTTTAPRRVFSSATVFDALGRRVRHQVLQPGVYFLIER
jgi:hypothetical protein